MFAIRIHGRGGQGVVTGAELLSVAAFLEGRHAQAFPSFGSERMGAPVVAFCRIDDQEIRLREPIVEADAVIVQDSTLLHSMDVFHGLSDEGYVLINSGRTSGQLGLDELAARLHPGRIRTVDATALALEHVGRPVPNAVLLGAFAAQCGVVALSSVTAAIRDRFPEHIAERNVRAATAAHDSLAPQSPEVAHAETD